MQPDTKIELYGGTVGSSFITLMLGSRLNMPRILVEPDTNENTRCPFSA